METNSKKKCKVVMLPTEEASDIVHISQGVCANTLIHKRYYGMIDKEMGDSNQHLYFLDEEAEIKEGDWRYSIETNTIYYTKIGDTCGYNKDVFRKIIATTDKLVIGREHDDTVPVPRMRDKYLPQPSKAFIEKYIKCYNSGEVIEYVT